MQKLENNKKQSIIAGSVAEVRKLKNLRMSYGIACLVETTEGVLQFLLTWWMVWHLFSNKSHVIFGCPRHRAVLLTFLAQKKSEKRRKKQQIILNMNAKRALLLQWEGSCFPMRFWGSTHQWKSKPSYHDRCMNKDWWLLNRNCDRMG